MTDTQLANLLAAYGALRAQHGPLIDPLGGDWAAHLALQAAHRLDDLAATSTSGGPEAASLATLQATMSLVGGLGTLFVVPISVTTPLHPHVPRVCGAIEASTLTHAPLMSPFLVSACFSVFSPVGHMPGTAWLAAAGAAAARGLSTADGHDLATLLEACNSVSGFREYMPPAVIDTLLRTAVREGAAGGLQPGQLLSLVSSAAGKMRSRLPCMCMLPCVHVHVCSASLYPCTCMQCFLVQVCSCRSQTQLRQGLQQPGQLLSLMDIAAC